MTTEIHRKRPKSKGETPYTQAEADKVRETFSTAVSYITMEDDTQKPKKPEHVFYTHFIQGLRYTETQDTALAAVQFEPHSPTGLFLINPRNAQTLPLSAFSGLVVHELLHIVFGHVHLDTEERRRYPKHCNVAMDMAINQIVLKDGYKLPWGKGVFADKPDVDMIPCLPQTVADKINERIKKLGGQPVKTPDADESYEFYLAWLLEVLSYLKDLNEQNGGKQQDCSSCGGSGKSQPQPGGGKGDGKGEKGEKGQKSDKSDGSGDGESEEDENGDKQDKKGKGKKSDQSDQDGDQEDDQDGSGDGDDQDDEKGESDGEHDHDEDGEEDCPDCDGQGKRDITDDLMDELDEMTGHDEWEAAESDMSDDEKDLVKRFVAQAAQEAASSSGGESGLPGHLQGAYKNLVKVLEPKMDWGQKIREFAGGCGKLTGFVRTMRENKHNLPGLYSFKPGGAVGMVVDTSGSVSEAEFGLFMAECVALSRDYDLEVFVLETSYGPTDEIWSITEAGVQDMYARIGYGGTNMKPGVMKFLELIEERDPDVQVGGIIVLSDGELGDDSRVTPEECDVPLLWAFSRDINPFKGRRFAGEIMYFDPNHKGKGGW